jgi:hypothetical protein
VSACARVQVASIEQGVGGDLDNCQTQVCSPRPVMLTAKSRGEDDRSGLDYTLATLAGAGDAAT